MVQQLSNGQRPVGMQHLPNSNKQVYWTGKVAIGLRVQAPRPQATGSDLLVQRVMGAR